MATFPDRRNLVDDPLALSRTPRPRPIPDQVAGDDGAQRAHTRRDRDAVTAPGLMVAPPAGADQCAPPGVDSASARANLAAAAKRPDEDKYTTPDVQPLDSIDVNALGLGAPG